MHYLSAICTIVVVLSPILGCGGGSKPANSRPGPTPVSGLDAGIDSDSGMVATSPLAEEDCQTLFEHIFSLVFAHQRNDAPEDERATKADLVIAKAKLRESLFAQCIGADRQAFHFDCALAASSMESIKACVGPE